MVIYAVILFLIMVYRPEGLLGKAEGKRNLFKRGGRINGSINN